MARDGSLVYWLQRRDGWYADVRDVRCEGRPRAFAGKCTHSVKVDDNTLTWRRDMDTRPELLPSGLALRSQRALCASVLTILSCLGLDSARVRFVTSSSTSSATPAELLEDGGDEYQGIYVWLRYVCHFSYVCQELWTRLASGDPEVCTGPVVDDDIINSDNKRANEHSGPEKQPPSLPMNSSVLHPGRVHLRLSEVEVSVARIGAVLATHTNTSKSQTAEEKREGTIRVIRAIEGVIMQFSADST